MIVSHLYVFFGEMSVFFALFDWVFFFFFSGIELHIFEINPLSVVSFVIIFSHPEGCLFTLLIASFVVILPLFYVFCIWAERHV